MRFVSKVRERFLNSSPVARAAFIMDEGCGLEGGARESHKAGELCGEGVAIEHGEHALEEGKGERGEGVLERTRDDRA